jgi:1,4-alpha-glucan branching enzyme
MKKKILFICLIVGSFLNYSNAQLLKWSPSFIQETTATVTITADARFGNKGLLDHTPTSDVFVHIGAITNQSTGASNWKYVKFEWGTANPLANAPTSGNNQWTFTINGGLRNFFGITNSAEKIQKIAILFRNGNGTKVLRNDDASDLYVPVYDNGNFARIDEPISKPTFNKTLVALDKKVGDLITITGNTNNVANLRIIHNNEIIGTTNTATTLSTNATIKQGGSQKFIFEATFSGTIVSSDSIQFFVPGPAIEAPLPDGIKDGITYLAGDTAAYLVLYAPGKTRISVLGDFNDWTETQAGQMNKTPEGDRFWIRIGKLTPGAEYAYQFLIDGTLRVADYNTELVLDPNSDNTIPSTTYPNLKQYPTNKTTGIVSVLQPGKIQYNWKIQNFKRPEKTNLIIYELLVRDFLTNRNYKTLKDSLPYLKRLGINAIELMPVSEFEGNLSWGYNPNYFFALDKFYGTENSFKEFIDACHEQGIAVIVDIVMNHAFGSSPHALMYWDGTNNKPAMNNPWLNPDAKHPFNVGYDFNHESIATKELVARVLKHWLTKYKLDGFRWDLSKGFTQTNNPNNVQAWGAYDASRISTWKRIYDSTQSVTPGSYCILEHFADNTEEKELANYGMMFWGNNNFRFNEAAMGYLNNSDFSDISALKKGWDKQHLIGYMESHDEDRLMYRNLNFGNQITAYSTRDTLTALKRMGEVAAFWAMVPGPKMLWQFGELGFPFSINTCTNGTVNDNCRLDNKLPVWDYYNNPNKKGLFDVYANLLKLRMNPSFLSTFTTNQYTYNFSGAVKTLQINDDSLKIVVVGNFDLTSKTATLNFPANGTWFSYLTKTSINVSGLSANVNLQPGEYHVYTNKDLNNTIVTSLFNPTNNSLSGEFKLYPNPVSAGSKLTFEINKSGEVQIDILDQKGAKVAQLYRGIKRAGKHEIILEAHTIQKIRGTQGNYRILVKTAYGQKTLQFLL